MKTEQSKWTPENGWEHITDNKINEIAQLVFLFGKGSHLKDSSLISDVKKRYPMAKLIGCSTSGEIVGTNVVDNSIIATAVKFDSSYIAEHSERINSPEESFDIGKKLVEGFNKKSLKHIFVLSDGLNVNGSELVAGMRSALPDGVQVTGGLAGDGADFKETVVITAEGAADSKIITAIGLYGENLSIGYGSFGGWDSFGIDRLVTKSKANILYELDNSPALGLYKSFLGEQAQALPASGLLFPLSMRTETDAQPVVRTILAVNEDDQSLTFAGDIPEGSYVRLMKANIDRLIDGAVTAASTSVAPMSGSHPDLAILISCVGRKLVLKQLVEEEVEGVRNVVGHSAAITGFYSYGEISPFSKDAKCELHNQTMTITTISEK
ncbi:MAG: FIST C-terminal domain-containing protein [Bacteroidetes bacterium]|nr:FIST C-terminal domain-containing protein [Bacteroidota bacterium]MBX7047459.1 FIST C-terminal domain-containing protein [Ignavibacteria bacterium]